MKVISENHAIIPEIQKLKCLPLAEGIIDMTVILLNICGWGLQTYVKKIKAFCHCMLKFKYVNRFLTKHWLHMIFCVITWALFLTSRMSSSIPRMSSSIPRLFEFSKGPPSIHSLVTHSLLWTEMFLSCQSGNRPKHVAESRTFVIYSSNSKVTVHHKELNVCLILKLKSCNSSWYTVGLPVTCNWFW